MKFVYRLRETEKKKLDKRITINVGGQRHETWASTLERLPGTRLALLASLLQGDESWDEDHNEYFFDRHPGAFATIIHFYRSEELHPQVNICGNVMKGELEFWGLTELDIEPCCWGHYSKFKDHKDTLAALDENFSSGYDGECAWGEKATNLQKFKVKIWRFLEHPGSSRWAQLYAVVSMFFVALSIGVFVLETHALFRVPRDDVTYTNTSDVILMGYYTIRDAGTSCCCPKKISANTLENTIPHPAMVIFDYICAAFFTIELILRIAFAPRKVAFFKELLNIIDMICLIPQFTAIIIKTVNPEDTLSSIFKTILALRIIRILRIFKLMKHYSGFKILVYTIKVSTKELFLIVIFLFMGVLIFASVIFYCDNVTFDSIPVGFWWALVTMTTVGYGDKVPNTEVGYVIGSICVICGVLTIAFTVPIVVNNFTLYYSHAQSRIKLPIHKRKQMKKHRQSRNRKATMDFMKKALKVDDFTNLDQIHSPRDSVKSGTIDVHASHNGAHLDTISESASETLTTSTTIGVDSPLPSSNPSRLHTEDNVDECKDSSRIRTVCGSVLDDRDLRLSLAMSSRMSENFGSQHRLESEQLLHGLADANQKLEDERERQLDRVRQRRDNLRSQRVDSRASRPSPSPISRTDHDKM
ncbi:potassium voltage-gated channel protein Shaw-like [Liolophura sinensis]|uniref:potassium voltage-gated channel protein Shaw-like n=1 Tax=Liolophura sinensis TaxID=3198878 RepID=UPI003158161D